MTTETRIEHSYPDALPFLRQHGPHAVVVLHDLLSHAQQRNGQLVVQATVREIAERLPFLSKDTVHRRLRDLHRARVIRPVTSTNTRTFQRRTFLVDLTNTGISVTSTPPTSD